ncbi:hypothetical protein PaeBR_06420 [Paenibacillus sp. BR2-3]|uniref:hypothetical protein n=1 Tax=Paenibacillus sp. BR2-3 TaxID=3048494 RepID=UPI0039776379
MRLLLIGVGSSARSCFNRLPDSNDWVKVFFLNNDSGLNSVRANHKFNYREKSSFEGLDGGTTHAKGGMAKLNDPIVELVKESSCAAVIIICFLGGEAAYGLPNLVNSIRVSGNPIYLVTSIPFAAAGKRKRSHFKECLDSIVDRLSGIYLLDLEEVYQYALITAKEQNMLNFLRFSDTILLDFFGPFVSELVKADQNGQYIFSYDYLESELTFQKVPNFRGNLYGLL